MYSRVQGNFGEHNGYGKLFSSSGRGLASPAGGYGTNFGFNSFQGDDFGNVDVS